MDRSKFFWLISRYKTIDNPISLGKVDQVIDVLQLGTDSRVLDIASGKAEMLCQIASKYGSRCVGVERSAYFFDEAIDKIKERGLEDFVTIHQMNGQDFEPDEATFDVAMCIGAEWVFGGLSGTLTSLARWSKPGGAVVVGTPFWTAIPPDEYLKSRSLSLGDFSTHAGNVALGEALGLTLLYSVVSSQNDWDHYEGLAWRAAYDFIRESPDDPDLSEIAELTEKDKASYLRHGRDCLSWAMYVFRRP